MAKRLFKSKGNKQKALCMTRSQKIIINPALNYVFKVNNRNTKTWCEICSKLMIKIPEQRQCLYC